MDAWLENAQAVQRKHTEDTRNRNQKEASRMASKVITEYQERAQSLYNDFAARSNRIQADGMLSPQGKATATAQAESDYRQKVDALQAEARMGIQRAAAKVKSALQEARAEKANELRTLLGDQLTASLYEKHLAVASPAKIVRMVEDAATPWAQTVLRELAWVEVERRALKPLDEMARRDLSTLESQLQALEPVKSPELVELERTANELRDTERLVDGLDIATSARQMGSLYGVTAQSMSAAMTTH